MADNFGLKIGIEGEREFKNALRDIKQSFKVLGSEMTLVTSQFDKNDKSVQAVTARNATLNKKIDAQKNKIETLRAALQNASESFGENDRRTQNWQIQLNKAQAELNGMERELEQSTIEADNLGDELDESGKSAEDAGGRFEKLGGILKGIGVAMGAVAIAAGAAAIKLGKEVVQQFGELEQNLGGSEAAFGAYDASIQKTGEEAYRNLGVSQSEYLATANKMGALFQGSGIQQLQPKRLSAERYTALQPSVPRPPLRLLKRSWNALFAANDNLDTANGFDIMSIFRDVFNEWFVADTSKKIRAVFKAKAQSGKHHNSIAPYGFKPSNDDPFVWDIDEPAAEVVREIFQMCIDGMGTKAIALALRERGLDRPSIHRLKREGKQLPEYKYPNNHWCASNISDI